MIKAIYLMFYIIYDFFKSTGSNDIIKSFEWKASVVFVVLQIFIFFIFCIQVELLTANHVQIFSYLSHSGEMLGVGLVLLVNYFAFLHNDRWKKYSSDFAHYSKKKKIVARITVAMICGIIVFLLCASFYQLSIFSKKQWPEHFK